MNNEDTILDIPEKKNNVIEQPLTQATSQPTSKTARKKQSSVGKHVAVAAAAGGLAVGGTGAVLLWPQGAMAAETNEAPTEHPDWVDEGIGVADSVNDDMSFQEAFDAARAEVGSGGVFEWHGQIYSTFTADEWNSMSADERAEYGSHFSWQVDTEPVSNPVAETQPTVEPEVSVVETAQVDDSQVEVVHTADNVATEVDDADIQILGVEHSDEYNANIGGMTIDGELVTLIDVDSNGTFDIAAIDENGNEVLDQDEWHDISEHNITVDDFGGLQQPMDDGLMQAGLDDIDPVGLDYVDV